MKHNLPWYVHGLPWMYLYILIWSFKNKRFNLPRAVTHFVTGNSVTAINVSQRFLQKDKTGELYSRYMLPFDRDYNYLL